MVTPVLSPATAFVTTQMMKDVMSYGTAKNLKKFSQERPAAGKTGTTDDYRDAWFVGYTPQLITGVWVGYDKPKPGGKGFTGGAVSAPIWGRFMRGALAGQAGRGFPETGWRGYRYPSTPLPAIWRPRVPDQEGGILPCRDRADAVLSPAWRRCHGAAGSGSHPSRDHSGAQ